jgi:hypothetical protein
VISNGIGVLLWFLSSLLDLLYISLCLVVFDLLKFCKNLSTRENLQFEQITAENQQAIEL